MGLYKFPRGDHEGGDGAFHIFGAAAVEFTVDHLRCEGGHAPFADIADGHDVRVAGEAEVRGLRAEAGVEVFDGIRALAEGDAVDFETQRPEEIFDHVEHARGARGDAGAANEVAGELGDVH